MKPLALILLAALALAAPARSVPYHAPDEEGSMSSTTFKEPRWTPVSQFSKELQITALEYRMELIIPAYSAHGTPVVRVDLRNLQPTERSFVLSYNHNNAAAIHRSVTLAPNGSASLTFPVFSTNAGGGSIYINNCQIKETTPGSTKVSGWINLFQTCSLDSTRHPVPSLLMDYALSPESLVKNLANREGEPTAKPPATGKTRSRAKPEESDFPCQVLRFQREAKDWPTDYRVYSTFDAVIVTPALHAAFPPAVRQALDDFSRAGGAVLVTPDNSESGGLSAPADQRRFRHAITHARDLLVKSNVSMKDSLTGTPMVLKSAVGVEILTPLLLLFAFAFVPYVFIANARRNRRLRALAIIPAGSIVFALAIGAFSLIFYGTTPTERLQSITILDQQNHRAITRGQFAVFSPSSLSRELNFPLDSTFSKRGFSYSQEGEHTVEIGDTYRLDGDWVKPLTTTFFDFQRIAHQPEKLDVKPLGNDQVQVINLLGAKITEGRLQLGKHTYALENIQPGETKVLKPTSTTELSLSRDELMERLFGKDTDQGRNWPKLLDQFGWSRNPKLPPSKLPPPDGTYCAHLEGSPFFPSPFGKRKTNASRSSIVVGTFSEASK